MATFHNRSHLRTLVEAVRARRIALKMSSRFAGRTRSGRSARSAAQIHSTGHGYVFIIAAKFSATFASLNLDFMNRGSSGNTVRELQKRWEKDTLELKPDVLSILIGVNGGVHPTYSGHQLMADEWERIVRAKWPAP